VQDVDSNRSPWLSPRDVATALHSQCATLEELIIVGLGRARRTNGTIYEILKEFAALKRLAVSTNHLVMLDAEFESFTRHLGQGEKKKRVILTSLSQQLPPNLETLCLQVDYSPRGDAETPWSRGLRGVVA
jgi:hypothetical protein